MAIDNWNTTDGVWSTGSNWSRGRAPKKGDTVNINTVSATPYTSQMNIHSESISNIGTIALNATLEIDTGDTLTVTGAIRNAATFTVDHGATVKAHGAITNDGTFNLNGTSASRAKLVVTTTTLSGGGVMNMTNGVITGTSTANVLTNKGTIQGTGYIGVGVMALANGATGVIDATGHDLRINTGGTTLANAGLIESSAKAGMVILNTTVNQSGGGTLLAAGVTDLQNVDVIGGTLAGAGHFNINSGSSTLDGATSPMALDGTVQVLAHTTLTVQGALAGTGGLSLYGGGKVVVADAGVTLSGGGHVNSNDVATDSIVGATTTATLTNVDDHFSIVGQLGGGSMVFVNEAAGSVRDTQSKVLTIDTGVNAVQNAGLIESDGSGGVTVASAVVNTGTLLAAVGALTLDGAVTGTGIGQINKGVLDVAAAFGETVNFVTGSTGVLKLTDFTDFTGTVKGFSKTGTNSIDLVNFTRTGATVAYVGTTASGILTVTNGGQTAHIGLTGNYLSSTFTLSSDGHGGTTIVDPPKTASLTSAMAAFGAHGGAGMGGAPHLAATRIQPLMIAAR